MNKDIAAALSTIAASVLLSVLGYFLWKSFHQKPLFPILSQEQPEIVYPDVPEPWPCEGECKG